MLRLFSRGQLPDHTIKREHIVDPCFSYTTKHYGQKIVPFGLSSAGYDIRVKSTFDLLDGSKKKRIDPGNFDHSILSKLPITSIGWRNYVVLPPNTVTLAESMEHFVIPRDVFGVVHNKSTYARCGLDAAGASTCLEPGWRGTLTLELANRSNCEVIVYIGEGIAQVVFHRLESPCEVSYPERKGKYQNQRGVTPAIVG